MEARLVEFARLLRRNGVRISPAEVGDAVAAAAICGLADRGALESALRATLVKRAADVPVFEALFQLHFSGLGRVLASAERSLVEALREAGLLTGDELEMAIRRLGRAAAGMGPLGQAVVAGDLAALARLLRAASLQLDYSLLGEAGGAFAARRLLEAAGGAELAAEAAAGEAAVRGTGLPPARVDALSGALRAAFEGVEQAARSWVEGELALRARSRRPDALPVPGAPPPLAADQARIEAAVRRLARRLEQRLRRRDRSRRGALALRRTLRRNLAVDGMPAHLIFRSRRPERPDLVVLCDVSESVRHVTRLMLLFLHALQGAARRIRTFVFVGEVGEVTERLRGQPDPSRAVDAAVAAVQGALAGNSSYGRAFRDLRRRHPDAVGRRTTLLVIGDGRSNYAPPEAWALADLRRRARRLLWICPEPRQRWGQGDSEMLRYAVHCDRVATVTSLAELEALAEALVPRRG